jgi:hypothetical protein
MFDTTFLGTWQGVFVVGIAAIFLLIIITFLIPRLRNVRIGKNGVIFGAVSEGDLAKDIPRIDRTCQLQLLNIAIGMQHILKASIDVSSLSPDTKDQRLIKLLFARMAIVPIFSSIHRNHLTKRLSNKGRQEWLNHVRHDIDIQFKVMQDYCDLEFDTTDLLNQIEEVVTSHFMEQAIPVLNNTIYEKLTIYRRMEDGEKKASLIKKSEDYLRGLETI